MRIDDPQDVWRRFGQAALFYEHDSLCGEVRFKVNIPLALVEWRISLWDCKNGQLIAVQELTERPIVGWPDELDLACQELGLHLQEQLEPYR